MVLSMLMSTRMKISKGGQISIPAEIRHRWGTSTLALTDEGERIVLEPSADDPIAAADGALAHLVKDFDAERLRQVARMDEQAAEDRRGRS